MQATTWVGVTILALVWPVGLMAAAWAQGQVPDAEMQKFQGAWVLAVGEKNGQQVPEAQVKQSRLTVTGKKMELFLPHESNASFTATITKVDPAKTPKEVQWVRDSGPNAGVPLTAIYEFQGPGQIRMCFNPKGGLAPKEFASKAGSGVILHTWKRAKK